MDLKQRKKTKTHPDNWDIKPIVGLNSNIYVHIVVPESFVTVKYDNKCNTTKWLTYNKYDKNTLKPDTRVKWAC